MHLFHTWLVWLITAISLFVLALLIAIAVKFNERANPVPTADHPQHASRGRLDGRAGADPGRDRDPLLPPAARAADHPAGRSRREGDRALLVLGIRVSRPSRRGFKFDANMVRAERPEAGPAAAARGRQRDGRAGEQGRAAAGHGRRRAPRLRDAVLRPQDRRRARAASTRRGSRPTARASITASARSSAATATPTCRSRSASSAKQAYAAWLAEAKQKFASDPGRDAAPSSPPAPADTDDRRTIEVSPWHTLLDAAHARRSPRPRPSGGAGSTRRTTRTSARSI